MGVDVSSIGVFNHWSPLADYTTRTLANISDQLPVPNGFELVLPNDYWKSTEKPMVIQSNLDYDGGINSIIMHYLNLGEDDNKKEERLKTLVNLLTYINKTQEFAIHPDLLNDGRVKSLIRQINKHNTHKVTDAEARNIIQRNILRASLDERNMKASYSPIDVVMDKFKDELKRIEDTASLERNLDDGGLSIARAQYNNSVGKKDVGIMANGLKAFFALTHYLNKYRKDPNIVDSNRYFLTKLSLGMGKEKYFSTISDIKFEEASLAILENAFKTFCPELFTDENGNPIIGPKLTFSNDDASLLISSLVSLATDNAKELALAKMNASIELACMHLFLVVMGYNAEDVVKFTTSTAFSKVAAILNRSKFDSQNINVRDAIELAQKDVAFGTDDEYQLKQIDFIYNCAQEMSAIAKIAAINQGVKVDELDSDKFLQNIQNVIANQVAVLSDDNFELSLNPDGSGRFVVTSIEELIRRTHNIDNPSIELIQKYANKLESVNSRNQQYRYIDDSLQIDMLRYYRDPDYKQFIIDFYDIFKHNFNVFDCIDNLAHFNKMLEAFVLAESTILQHSSRARAVLQEAKRSYQGNRVNNYIYKQESDSDGNTWTKKIKLFDKIGFSDAIKRKASKFYDDYILSEWIKEFGQNFEITYEDEDGNIVELNLKTNQDIAKFANFVAYELIPILKEVYPKNTFLHYIKPDFKLIRKSSKELFLPRYIFNFDIDTLTTVQDQNKAFYINQGFNELSDYTLDDVGIKTTKGGNIKLGELLYLYDRLVSSSIGQSSLDRAFDLYLSKVNKDSIAHQIANIELEHDTGARPDIKFDPLLFTAFCYASLIRNKANGIMSYDYNKKTKKSQEFSIKEKYLFNLDSIEEHKDTVLKAEQFLDAIRNGSLMVSLNNGIWTIEASGNSDIWFEFKASNDNFTVDQFIRDLARDNQKDALNDFLSQIKNLPKPSFKGYQTVKVYKTFQENMNKLGVQVEIINDPNAANGYVQDGVIYLNTKNSIISTPMHELLHLVFGVMKVDNFDNFQRLMELVYTSKQIQDIYSELNKSEEYGNLMDLDKKEEAFCRAIELIINGKAQTEDIFTDGENDLYETVSVMLTPIIGKTFGINPPTELINFLNDSVGNLKRYNSTLFMPIKSDSTGYLDSKIKIIQSTKISKFIEKLVKDGILIETEC